jgi:hypothetical protein
MRFDDYEELIHAVGVLARTAKSALLDSDARRRLELALTKEDANTFRLNFNFRVPHSEAPKLQRIIGDADIFVHQSAFEVEKLKYQPFFDELQEKAQRLVMENEELRHGLAAGHAAYIEFVPPQDSHFETYLVSASLKDGSRRLVTPANLELDVNPTLRDTTIGRYDLDFVGAGRARAAKVRAGVTFANRQWAEDFSNAVLRQADIERRVEFDPRRSRQKWIHPL